MFFDVNEIFSETIFTNLKDVSKFCRNLRKIYWLLHFGPAGGALCCGSFGFRRVSDCPVVLRVCVFPTLFDHQRVFEWNVHSGISVSNTAS